MSHDRPRLQRECKRLTAPLSNLLSLSYNPYAVRVL
jgi:hypothetical protein